MQNAIMRSKKSQMLIQTRKCREKYCADQSRNIICCLGVVTRHHEVVLTLCRGRMTPTTLPELLPGTRTFASVGRPDLLETNMFKKHTQKPMSLIEGVGGITYRGALLHFSKSAKSFTQSRTLNFQYAFGSFWSFCLGCVCAYVCVCVCV